MREILRTDSGRTVVFQKGRDIVIADLVEPGVSGEAAIEYDEIREVGEALLAIAAPAPVGRMAPAAHRMLGHLHFSHLPEPLHPLCRKFNELALAIATSIPDADETVEALRKLVEARDAAVRAYFEVPF